METSNLFPFPLGEDQQRAIEALANFVDDRKNDVFILNGYAGTGKTSLVGGFIKYLFAKNTEVKKKNANTNTPYDIKVLASTGRAAKILSDKTVTPAKTIHSLLYRPAYIEDETEVIQFELFPLKEMLVNTRVYIVDEASMVGDIENPTVSAARFNEGNVLNDLFKYDPAGKFIFVGDPCQLNPVGQKLSPALEPTHLKTKYGKSVVVHTLNQIFRQRSDNDILLTATKIRKMWQTHVPQYVQTHYGQQEPFTNFPLSGYKRIHLRLSESELINFYVDLVRKKGYNYATMICHSNKECAVTGDTVRQMLHARREHLIEGDLLLVTQNNYLVDLVNGDLVEVKRIMHETRKSIANISFVKVEVIPLHKRVYAEKKEDKKECVTEKGYLLYFAEDILKQKTLNLDAIQTKELMRDFIARMAKYNIRPPKKGKMADADHPFFRALSKDPFMNSLRATYGYALTCHKAQGGEWDEVFVNLAGTSLYARRGKELYQWAYTAVTRAKNHLHLIAGRYIF